MSLENLEYLIEESNKLPCEHLRLSQLNYLIYDDCPSCKCKVERSFFSNNDMNFTRFDCPFCDFWACYEDSELRPF